MTTQTITAIRPKRSYTPNRAPLPTELIQGELFVNVNDKTIYIRHDNEDSVVLLSSQDGGQSATYTDLANLEGAEHAGRVMISNGNGTFKFEEIEFTQNINNVTEEYITNNITRHYNTVTNPTKIVKETVTNNNTYVVESEYDKLLKQLPEGQTLVSDGKGGWHPVNLKDITGTTIQTQTLVSQRDEAPNITHVSYTKDGGWQSNCAVMKPGHYRVVVQMRAVASGGTGIVVRAKITGSNVPIRHTIATAKNNTKPLTGKPTAGYIPCKSVSYVANGTETFDIVVDRNGKVIVEVVDNNGNTFPGLQSLDGNIQLYKKKVI